MILAVSWSSEQSASRPSGVDVVGVAGGVASVILVVDPVTVGVSPTVVCWAWVVGAATLVSMVASMSGAGSLLLHPVSSMSDVRSRSMPVALSRMFPITTQVYHPLTD